MKSGIITAATSALLFSGVANAAEIKVLSTQATEKTYRGLVGRFSGSNHMPTKIGPLGCCREMPVNEEPMMAADMISFMESVV